MVTKTKFWDELRPGSIWRGKWQTGVEGAPELPILAVAGNGGGARLLITGGVHGDEYEGPTAIQNFLAGLTPDKVQGVVVGIPVANGAAWQARSRTNPADRVDLNRVFAGRPEDASVTHHLAEFLFDHFVRECDMLVDLHSGGVRLVHLPMAGWYAGEAEKAEIYGRTFGADFHPWLMPDVPGVLSYEAQRAGKIALGAEWGGGGRLDLAGRDAYRQGLERMLARLMGKPIETSVDGQRAISGSYQESPAAGVFVPLVALGEHIEMGAAIGTVYDEFGEASEEVRAQRGGIMAALANVPLVERGDRIAYIG